MSGSLVRVWTDIGARKPAALLAKIIDRDGVILTIKYLSESDLDHVWRYEEDTYEIDDDSVAEYLNTDSELELGFVQRDDGFVKMDPSDEDYVPSDEDEEESSDEETDLDEEDEEDEDLDDEDEEDLEEDEDEESNIDEE
jgi:Mn-containing catalase